MMEFVSWDDDIPKWMESHKIPWFQTTNQMSVMDMQGILMGFNEVYWDIIRV